MKFAGDSATSKKKIEEDYEKKKKEIAELEAENIEISKKRHTIVHKQKSLEHKLEEIITKTEISSEEVAEVRERIKKFKRPLAKSLKVFFYIIFHNVLFLIYNLFLSQKSAIKIRK